MSRTGESMQPHFGDDLFYDRFPGEYEDTRDTNPLDFLLSGILAAPLCRNGKFPVIAEPANGRSKNFIPCLRQVLGRKYDAGCALRDGRYTRPLN